MNYTFFDVETANLHNDSICSISILETDGSEIISTFSSLVNPEAGFDNANMEIHHITPLMVKDKPTLSELWPSISKYFVNHIVGGHNVSFDITVLRKHLAFYDIILPNFDYICTMAIARTIPSIHSVKLNDLCGLYDIPLDHHNSMSDATASLELFKLFRSSNDFKENQFIKNSAELGTNSKVPRETSVEKLFSEKTVKMQELKAYVKGLLADGVLNLKEISGLKKRLSRLASEEYDNFYFSKIYDLVLKIYEDGKITEHETESLFTLLNEFIDPLASNCCNAETVEFNGKLFCLSGNFEHGAKKDIEKMITDRGGICKGTIVKATDYLIVGGAGNEHWKMGNFGSKVEKALKMQDDGLPIKILGENQFFNLL